ncbi:hypothetical protein [Variovorax sp. J22R115]|uniref:hypothetical protein n=1 Tax=Variovorax sp. J22R115 TaxID=3053509 RepID=UPI0025777361|nr:hypothetical protein [Variovorax sp. J22R115]MDM0052576.1 hypothetical protein [Variovorax sp. J22R115]
MFELFGKKRKANFPLPGIDHPAMGHLSGASGVLQGRIESEHGVIVVSINPDGQPIEASLSLAEKVMKNISALNDRGRGLVAADALDAYNSDWRFGERINDGGIMEMFEKPPRSKAEFCASLMLSMVQVTGSERVTLSFACEEMSWKHNFSVTSLDGVDFNNVRIDLHV